MTDLLDRIAIYRTGNRQERDALHRQTAALKSEAMERRRQLAAGLGGLPAIDPAVGIGLVQLGGRFGPVRRECYEMIEARGARSVVLTVGRGPYEYNVQVPLATE